MHQHPLLQRPLLALAAAAFGIGTTEFVIMGLLPNVAADLQVTAQGAGMLVTGYALGVTVGAPLLAIVTARWPRRAALLALVALFTLGNVLCALAPGYATLMVARVITAFCHAAFFGIGSVVAAQLVPPDRRAQAISIMFTGLTLANVLGVPFGTALGQWLGWRATFWAVAAIGVIALTALSAWLPRTIAMGSGGNLLREFRSLARPQVQLALLVSTLSSVSLFSVFTYIAYLLRDVSGWPTADHSWILLIFGAGITVGGLIGGRLADWKILPVLGALLVAVAVVLVAFSFTSEFRIATLMTLFVWGLLSFAIGPATQVRVIDTAHEAPALASTINQGAFNLGNATGAWLGGLMIGAGLSLTQLPLLGAGIALLAVIAVIAASLLEWRDARVGACA
ncbi:MAG: MFS transporter [Luteimonas sp.]